jgi:hypothetical protein
VSTLTPDGPTSREWTVTEVDALDLFSMLSYTHRRLDWART